MKTPFRAAVAAAAFCISCLPLWAQRNEIRKVEDAVEVFRAMTLIPEKALPDLMMKDAYGIAILPGVQKAAFVVGGQYGNGIIMVKGADGSWGAPLFISITGGSIGWQVGVQSSDLVLFFRTKRSVEGVIRGSFTLGVDVSVAAGGLGRQAGAGTDSNLEAEIYTYARSRGLFAGVMLAGAKLDVDYDATSLYYGKPGISERDILDGLKFGLPPSAMELKKALEEYARTLK
jgi:lipid-binding SYLF domain-containing protein